MIYELGGTKIDFETYREQVQKGYMLQVLKEMVDMTGCTLAQAKELYDRMIQQEGIEVSPLTLEIWAYCMAELREEAEAE